MTDKEIGNVAYICTRAVEVWRAKRQSSFSWPLDGVSQHEWGYQIHCSIVDAWNAEGRNTDLVEFHLRWLADLENVRKALS